ncbi:ATP-binding protein [Salinirubellus sp. GCM10025818]|uniref:ATP-binding protein n=1 Tax=Salinirubellus TaxID=2162630 RepID=UPI0030CAD8E9
MSSREYPDLFDACTPRDDVLNGTLQEDQFAASLATVAHSPEEAAPVYKDASEFFDMTYPTEGLQTLLSNLSGRFLASTDYDNGGYSSSILCLDTRFGGGKTHDLIASYHLAKNPTNVRDLDRHLIDAASIVGESYLEAVEDGLSVETAVFVGGHVDGQNARSAGPGSGAPKTRTMWGEIAYQLYGIDGYEYIQEYDQAQNAPGGNTLKGLFKLGDGPALILIDEIAAYLEAASAVEVGDATLASQTLTFILSLLETASEVDDVTVVYSIADTAFEEEAEDVRGLIDELNQIGRRQHKTVTPTSESEVGQVLQHRLFETIEDGGAAKAAESYFQYYADSDRQFPQEATDAGFVDQLEREYPFHPTIIDTLTEKIDTIPKFQRTRGALKLLARAVYYLWNHQPKHYTRHWIRLYDLTPADDAPDGSIDSTLRETLFEFVDLSSAVTADIYSDDDAAHAQLEDRKWVEKGIPPLGSHLTTTVLWHSLAYGEQATGLTRAEMNAALGHPDIRFDNYDSALEALSGGDMNVACYFLYDEERVRFKSQPNLVKIINQRVENTPDAQARNRFESRLENSEVGTGAFETVVFPESPADVPDKLSKPQLAVMHMDTAPVLDGGSEPPKKVQQLYQKAASRRGEDSQSRVYKNYVLFLAPDKEQIQGAVDEARQLEAIEALLDDSQQTADLSNEQIEELRERRDKTHGLLGEFVRGVYRHLYYVDRDGLTHLTINATEANGGTTLVTAVEETLDDRLIRADAGPKGVAFFKQKLWQQTQDSMTTEQLVAQFAKKPGLPYLLNTKPLRKTVAKMVDDASYTYWDSTVGENGLAYWDGDEDDRPENWRKANPLSESPDVQTSISDSDVKIGDEYVVYTEIGALLDVHHDVIRPPETGIIKCAEPGCEAEVDEEGDYCLEHGDGPEDPECSNCGKTMASKSELNPRGLCPECAQPQDWEQSTSLMAPSRAFNEIRTHALGKSPSGSDPGIDHVIIELGGDDQLSKGSFIAQRQALKDRADNVSIRMRYETKSSSGASYEAQFTGGLNEFSHVTNQPDPFDGASLVEVKLRVDLKNPEPISNAGDDLLAELQDELGSTNIDVKVQGRGPVEVPAEVQQ